MTGMVAAPACRVCGRIAARVELIAPGQLPVEWDRWNQDRKDSWLRWREPDQWHLLFEGVATGNGSGDPVTEARALRIIDAFRLPLTWAQVHTAGFHDDASICRDCDAAYCYIHWRVSQSGYGTCARGHGKRLDPHW